MSKKLTSNSNNTEAKLIEVKSKFDAEFRRWSFKRHEEAENFEKFSALIEDLHRLTNIQFIILYVDPSDNDLLPINNDDNFHRALKTARPLLRIIIQRRDVLEEFPGFGTMKPRNNLISTILGQTPVKGKFPTISIPHDFRQVSAIIDVDIVPETHRRVRLLKHGSEKPLGFYIRDGTSVRVTSTGLEKQPGIFISRLVPGGLAESTGLLAVNDEVIEVNGIEVAGKTLDQVTDMMVANSSNLIITVKPANQRTLTSPRRGSFSRTSQLSTGSHHTNHTNDSDDMDADDQDEVVDLTGEMIDDNHSTHTTATATLTAYNSNNINNNNNNNNSNNNNNNNNNNNTQHHHQQAASNASTVLMTASLSTTNVANTTPNSTSSSSNSTDTKDNVLHL